MTILNDLLDSLDMDAPVRTILVGVLFSIYLTFLEPFVIGASCAWCLTSALIMTALFWLSLAPARLALPNSTMSKSSFAC